jgi:murein L,D-transpeptidase YcbB/YkuD
MGVSASRIALRSTLILVLASMAAPVGTPAAHLFQAQAQEPAASHWSADAVAQLVEVIQSASAEGLHPADYQLNALRQAVAAGQGAALDATADRSALELAHDYLFGRVSDRAGMQWLIQRSPYEASQLSVLLRQAIASGTVRDFYAGLLPRDPRYRALRTALAETTDRATRDRLRANLERWRWMPRDLPSDYLYVNVPAYRLQLFRDAVSLASYDIVVGAKDTPTPQMVSPTGSLVVNPAWYVPESIARKSRLRPGRGGYVWKATADGGRRIIQLPGPRNALGRIKFNLDNDQSIYLHDTNAKSLFDREQRALSHGCIRVKDIDQLAADLLSQGGGDTSAFEEALAGDETRTLRLPRTWPVYIVYFTADVDETGSVTSFADPYGYDAKVIAALDGRPLQMASS